MRSHRHLIATALLGISWIGVSAATARADDPPSFEKLSREFRKAYTNGDYKKALEVSEKQHELKASAVDPIYNIACMQCLLGEKAKAFEWLEKSVDAGYNDADHMANDYDLRSIWGEARFRTLVQKTREKNAKSEPESKKDKKGDKPAKSDDKPKKADDEPAAPKRPSMNERQRQDRVNELTQQLMDAAKDKEYEKAMKLALEARDVADVGLTNYNVACMYSLLGKTDEAFKSLERSLDRGGFGADMVEQIKGDSDLDSLRNDKRYEPLLKRAKGMGRGERVDFKWRIVAPNNLDKSKKVPLLVALHPFGGSMDETTDRWREAAQEVGAVMVCPQGTLKMDNGSYQWGLNTDEIEKNIMKAMDAAMDDYNIDQDKVILAGFSQGGWLTWTLGLLHPDTFHGLIPVGGHYRPVNGPSATPKDMKKVRVFVMVGADEQEEVVKSNRDAVGKFKNMGAEVKLNVYDGIGHEFPNNAKEEQIKALKFVLQ